MVKSNVEKLLGKSLLVNVILSAAVVTLALVYAYSSITNSHASNNIQTTVSNQASPVTSVSTSSGTTLAGINQQFNSSELAAINSEPLGYYETAGERLLNGTLTDQVITSKPLQYNAFIINGKPSVIYIGAETCPFCGENRWAMALALAKFGNFTTLFKGYSSLVDGDVPTIYWNKLNYSTTYIDFKSYYNSKSINFVAAEYVSPITQGFQVSPLTQFIQVAPNSTYASAMSFMNSTGKFQGTPFTFWGKSLVQGADAVTFGNSSQSTPLLNQGNGGWSHTIVLNMLKSFNSQFAWGQYAAADVYIAQVCPTIGNNASVCKLPAIIRLEQTIGTS